MTMNNRNKAYLEKIKATNVTMISWADIRLFNKYLLK